MERINKRRSAKESTELAKCHVEGESKHHNQEDCQNNYSQESFENALKHKHIYSSVCMCKQEACIVHVKHLNLHKLVLLSVYNFKIAKRLADVSTSHHYGKDD